MDQKFIVAASLKEKKQVIDQFQNKKLTQQEIENIYKNIHNYGKDSNELLEYALDKNIGQMIPDKYYSNDFNKKMFEYIIDNVKELDQISIYCKVYERNVQNAYRNDLQKYIFKHIGFVAEKLILEFRKQGNICQKLHLNQKQNDNLDNDKLANIIDMIICLCPKDLSFNPELFQLMLIPFKFQMTVNEYNLDKLEKLAQVLLEQCNGKGQSNLNQVHDWLALLSGIFQQAHNGNCMGLHILLSKIGSEMIHNLLLSHSKYLLFNFFNNSQNTLRIFQGLTQYSIVSENLLIIKDVSELILNQVEKTNDKTYWLILEEVYHKFILTTIMGNIQMFNKQQEILEILSFYIIGISQIHNTIPLEAIELMMVRLKLLMNLQFQRDISTPFIVFFDQISKYYPKIKENQTFSTLYQFIKDKSYNYRLIDEEKAKAKSWRIQIANLKEGNIDPDLLNKDSDDYVGLENLTNTCFMNSFLQSLFMSLRFRQFMLEQKIQMQQMQFQQENSMITSLQKLFMLLTYQKQGFCSPYELKRDLREPYSNTNEQQDVGEFAHHFLEDLIQLMPTNAKKELSQLFFGSQRSILECTNCPKNIAKNHRPQESFLGLDLHFNKSKSQIFGEQCNLIEMIQSQFEKEFIDFKCEKCGKKSENNSKSIEVLSLPPFLIMTIHRFTYDPATQSMTKMLTKVPFQFEINMKDVFQTNNLDDRSCIYRLYAFIVHLGKNSNSGHYICYARQLQNQPEMWIAFDDTYITSLARTGLEFDEQLMQQIYKISDEETPYILFYQNESLQQLKIQH